MRQRAVRVARPFFLRPVAIELDAVVVRIAQVERLADAVVARAVERDAGFDQPAERIGKRRARRVEDRDMVKAGRAGRRRRTAFALPGVQTDMVVIAAGRDEGGARAVALPSARSRARRNRRRARARCRRLSDGRGRYGFPDRSEPRVSFRDAGFGGFVEHWRYLGSKKGAAPVARSPAGNPLALRSRPRGA